ncbi:UDP-N-acetylmuramoyl-L-alanyl-D-glutamate--2,6-diaminopimelate ligase [Alkalibacillus almallahensis]|uniref:UDP-N-acetylmuramoyl-L-alanyl-D-glutamate--2, 6-diaminopimelate ligase n=1 Tax=Alkalibacillus almallahensis TaxID=1379154 RepID=UPI00141F0304|nr:UDP-N-acetylmuramoyl-L-alanyl-D-glutamate--2,6-diaminopimelate ligase [Alkalibacillus almallahensis]NIK11051.1 UDP-N-acetylmuramoyl-L-alanyl-D-glutamate--2,6-diaminopimelate ligase [Alkalibacillus almallahensis]
MRQLHDLIKEIKQPELIDAMDDPRIGGLVDHSQKVKSGDLFIAVQGYEADGHQYIQDAIDRGAVAVIGEKDLTGYDVPYIKVDNSRHILGELAKVFYDYPFEDKLVIGVTGTNGKTTTSHMLHHLLVESNYQTGLIGTVKCVINGQTFTQKQTTPSVLDLYQHVYDSQDDVMVIEVSSHALDQNRLAGVTFDYGIFTNLSYEHLDYHADMWAYFKAKRQLFSQLKPYGQALVNVDNDWGKQLYEWLESHQYHVKRIGQSFDADVRLMDMDCNEGCNMTLKIDEDSFSIHSPQLGLYNLYNLALAFSVANDLVEKPQLLVDKVKTFSGVPGRFDLFEMSNGVKVVVDYAHTSDAIQQLLATVYTIKSGRLFHIFGFKGNRDKSKRGDMVRQSLKYSDQTTLTIGELNGETVEGMFDEMSHLVSVWNDQRLTVEKPRHRLIEQIIKSAKPEDWVVISGQGHELYDYENEWGTKTDGETVNYVDRLLATEVSKE